MPIDARGALVTLHDVTVAEFLAIDFDSREMDKIVASLDGRPADAPFGYVVTANVDHIVKLNSKQAYSKDLVAAYSNALVRVCDSRVLSGLARLRGVSLSVVPGSDLTERLVTDVLKPGDRVSIIGGEAATVRILTKTRPGVQFVQHIPPMGLLTDRGGQQRAARFIAENPARFCLIALGCPQQEILADLVQREGRSRGLGLCVGASLDFLTGKQKRAPGWLQRARLEWLYRLLSNPRRLWRRYLLEGPRILAIVMRWKRPIS